jgi:streptogramin lyase
MTEIRDRWLTPGPQPNGLQAAPDGLWVIDQTDNHLYKLSYADGSVISRVPTEGNHSSGVTHDGESAWVASTFGCVLLKLEDDGTTAASYDTPGVGVIETEDAEWTRATGAHGMHWVDPENMWVAVPPAQKLFLVDPATMRVKHSVPAPGRRPHGVFVHQGQLWCADTEQKRICRLDSETGDVIAKIDVPDPEVHGMTFYDGDVWFCCANTRRVCTLPLPS